MNIHLHIFASCAALGNNLLNDIDGVQADKKVRKEGSLTAAATDFCGYHASIPLQFLIDVDGIRLNWSLEIAGFDCS
ncbi:hypothetical protein MKX03_007044 [Papaver bracteatum]|nr:hypothetical protein MKX03_007044 [Papaver bracteatum]